MDTEVYHAMFERAARDFMNEKDHRRRRLLAQLVRTLSELTGTALPVPIQTWFKARENR